MGEGEGGRRGEVRRWRRRRETGEGVRRSEKKSLEKSAPPSGVWRERVSETGM